MIIYTYMITHAKINAVYCARTLDNNEKKLKVLCLNISETRFMERLFN